MYTKLLKLIDNKNIFAHINDTKKESLIEHTLLTKKYYKIIIKTKKLDNIIDNLCSTLGDKDLIRDMFNNAIIFHDIGKVNPSFQKEKLNNDVCEYIEESKYNNNHSLLSSYIYLVEYFKEIESKYPNTGDRKTKKEFKKIRMKLKYILLVFSYIISRHHSSLNDNLFSLDENNYISKLENLNKEIIEDNYYVSVLNEEFSIKLPSIKPLETNTIELMVLSKLLYSLLVSSDYMATYEFMNNDNVNNYGVFTDDIKKSFFNSFNKDNIVTSIRNKEYSTPINELRSDIFREVEESYKANKDSTLFFLESPTGSGKTYSSINLMLKVLEEENINKAYYVFPFNNLSEQTYNTILDIFPNNKDHISLINSVTEIKEVDNNYDRDYLNKLFMNYPLSLISHVGLFNTIYGVSKTYNYNFYDLANSVIVLDEIQSYDISIWKEMINTFSKYAALLNIKIIIMSATLPKLDILLEEESFIVDLLPNKSTYFNNPLFKDRVKLDFSLLYNKKSINDIKSTLDKEYSTYNKILIEFQDKKNCRLFYELVKGNFPGYKVYEITGDDNIIYRNMVISRIKEKNSKVIIVATSVIEAGIDIDMDLGMKELSVLESEEQFLGRINRSCLKTNCKAIFFELEDSKVKFLLKDDLRIRYSLKKKFIQDVLYNKNFISYYSMCLKDLNIERSRNNSDNYIEFEKDIELLNFDTINEKMKLIKTDTIQVLIPHNKIEGYNGEEILKAYIDLSTTPMRFSEYKIKASKLMKDLSIFTFSMFNKTSYNLDKLVCFKGLYIIDTDLFITDEGKLDREQLEEYLKN